MAHRVEWSMEERQEEAKPEAQSGIFPLRLLPQMGTRDEAQSRQIPQETSTQSQVNQLAHGEECATTPYPRHGYGQKGDFWAIWAKRVICVRAKYER